MPPPPSNLRLQYSMATTISSSSTPQTLMDPSQLSLSSATASRRVPPPCWSADETTTLIDAYREKWYSLRRGNLRSHHWQEVADHVASSFPASPKTSVQCRHKMEKLRKRYRAEKQRAAAFAAVRNSRFRSNWPHYRRMDAMERGVEVDDEEEDAEEVKDVKPNFVRPVAEIYRNNVNSSSNKFAVNVNENRNMFQSPPVVNGGNGYRVRLPVRSAPPVKFYSDCDEFGVPNTNVRSGFGGGSKGLRNEHVVRGGMGLGRKVEVDERKKGSPAGEMVEAIRVLGDGFVRMEKMKMDMARQIEEMRMEMEMKRTAMILDSQQQIVEAFADAVFGSVTKKQKKMPTPEC